jgi:hypothetical protein
MGNTVNGNRFPWVTQHPIPAHHMVKLLKWATDTSIQWLQILVGMRRKCQHYNIILSTFYDHWYCDVGILTLEGDSSFPRCHTAHLFGSFDSNNLRRIVNCREPTLMYVTNKFMTKIIHFFYDLTLFCNKGFNNSSIKSSSPSQAFFEKQHCCFS